MLERPCDGIVKAKWEGRSKGRVPTVRRQAAEIIRLKAEGLRTAEIARKLGIGRASIYRVLRELRNCDHDGSRRSHDAKRCRSASLVKSAWAISRGTKTPIVR